MRASRLRMGGLAAMVLLLGGGVALAQNPAIPTEAAVEVAKAELQVNLNIVWTALAAFLVFFMQAGFAMVEAGFTRAKNACNIVMKNLMDFSIGSLAWFLVGFGLMFGAGTSGFIGWSHFAASDFSINELNWTFWIFQCVFAGTAATIVSGAMAGVLVVVSVEFIDGAFGTIMAGLLNTPGTPGYVAGASVGTQLLGVGAVFVWALGAGLLVFTLIKKTIGLHVSRDEELRGLDIGEHGMEAYSGFQTFTTQ